MVNPVCSFLINNPVKPMDCKGQENSESFTGCLKRESPHGMRASGRHFEVDPFRKSYGSIWLTTYSCTSLLRTLQRVWLRDALVNPIRLTINGISCVSYMHVSGTTNSKRSKYICLLVFVVRYEAGWEVL